MASLHLLATGHRDYCSKFNVLCDSNLKRSREISKVKCMQTSITLPYKNSPASFSFAKYIELLALLVTNLHKMIFHFHQLCRLPFPQTGYGSGDIAKIY